MMSEPLGKVGAHISREHSLLKSIIKKVIAENQCEKHKNSSLVRRVDFSQDLQGRLVHVRTVVVATCIKI